MSWQTPRHWPAWSDADEKRIAKLSTGLASDWLKKSLAPIREKLRTDLLAAQSSKCGYCRSTIVDEIGRVEIDHILPKDCYPNFTYERLNFVATCKRCNHRKGNHNPLRRKTASLKNYPRFETSFLWIHPLFSKYGTHIRIGKGFTYTAVSGSPLGKAVIEQCRLNEMAAVVVRRARANFASQRDAGTAILQLMIGSAGLTDGQLSGLLKSRAKKNLSNEDVAWLSNLFREGRLELFASVASSPVFHRIKLLLA